MSKIIDIHRLKVFLTCICDLQMYDFEDHGSKYKFKLAGIVLADDLKLGYSDQTELSALFPNIDYIRSGMQGLIAFLICLVVDSKVMARHRRIGGAG